MAWTAPRTWVSLEKVTAALMNTHLRDNLSFIDGRELGYAEVTSSQGSITTEVDATGLSATVTVGTSRRLKITYQGLHQIDTADNRVLAGIKEGSTYLNQAMTHHSEVGAAGRHTAYGSAVVTPSSGSHTYKITLEAPDTGTATLTAATAVPAFILVEDIGAA